MSTHRISNSVELADFAASLYCREIAYPCEIVIRNPKSNRSLQANAYLWGALYPAIQKHIRDTTGHLYTTDDLHAYFKATLLPAIVVVIDGKSHALAGSSAKLSVAEFAEFTQQIEAYFVSDLGGQIPAHPSQEQDYEV